MTAASDDEYERFTRISLLAAAVVDGEAWGSLDDVVVIVDHDGDGVFGPADNCEQVANPDQADPDGDGIGLACNDIDGDGVEDDEDLCPLVADPEQADGDADGIGDACDEDGRGVLVSLAADSKYALWAACVGSGVRRRLWRPDEHLFGAALSLDGQQVAYLRDQAIWLQDVDGGEEGLDIVRAFPVREGTEVLLVRRRADEVTATRLDQTLRPVDAEADPVSLPVPAEGVPWVDLHPIDDVLLVGGSSGQAEGAVEFAPGGNPVRRSRQPSRAVAWAPSGDRFAAIEEVGGDPTVLRLVSYLREGGQPAVLVPPTRAMQPDVLGWSAADPAPPEADSDGDGVADDSDSCPDRANFTLAEVRRLFQTGWPSMRPSLAWSGAGFAATCNDAQHATHYNVYVTVLGPSGEALREPERVREHPWHGIEISDVVWNGREYAMVWREDHVGGQFLRLSQDGAHLGGIVTYHPDSYWVDLEWMGDGYAVSTKYVDVVRLSSTGQTLDSHRANTGPGTDNRVSLAWTGQELGVVWQRSGAGSGIAFRRMSPAGVPQGGSEILVSEGQVGGTITPDLVWNPDAREFGIVWRCDQTGRSELYFARVSEQGERIGGISQVPFGETARVPGRALVWTGTEYAVAFEAFGPGPRGVYVARISAAGDKIGGDTFAAPTSSGEPWPSMVWTGEDLGIVWIDDSDGQRDAYFARGPFQCP